MKVSKLYRLFFALYIAIFLTNLVKAEDGYLDELYKSCIEAEKEGKYTKGLRCFSSIPKDSIYYPHALAYKVQLSMKLRKNIDPYVDELLNYSDYALVQDVLAQIMAKYYKEGKIDKAYYIALYIDYRAIKNKGYFLNIQRKIYAQFGDTKRQKEVERILSTKYVYTRPGLLLFMKNINKQPEGNIERVVNILIRRGQKRDAIRVAKYIRNINKKYYYIVKAYARMRRIKQGERYLAYINPSSIYYGKAVYELSKRAGYRKKIEYVKLLGRLGQTKYQSLIALNLMKTYFYKGLRNPSYLNKLEYFASFVRHPDYLEDKFWYLALKEYRLGNYEDAANYLARNTKYFKNDPSKPYYWLHLIYKNLDPDLSTYYLIKAASYNNPRSFYSIISRKKLNVRKTFLDVKRPLIDLPLDKERDKKLFLMLKLKHLGIYEDAYIEAKYYYKSARYLEEKLKLHKVFPEITAREFARNPKFYGYSFPKPFAYITNEDLVSAIMRQERFFDTYAVSRTGARGLMQIMPATGRWLATKLGFRNFRIDDLYIPEVNIRFGRFYIRYLLGRFNGNLIYAIAAYNAGPGRVRGFIKRNNIRDIAEFVEFFPLSETRNYVKKVYINYIFYSE